MNAALNIAGQLEGVLPFRAVMLRRNADHALMDKGKVDGVATGTVYEVVKKGKIELLGEGVGFKYLPQDVAGTFTVTALDERIASGNLARQGYFDTIAVGDELVIKGETTAKPPAAPATADPELRSLLMLLRQSSTE